MKLFLLILLFVLISAFWLDWHDAVRKRNEELNFIIQDIMEEKFRKQREFAELYKEKNRWAREVDRLKKREKNGKKVNQTLQTMTKIEAAPLLDTH